jgi:uncharacterized protein YodC (DUF2158 family)
MNFRKEDMPGIGELVKLKKVNGPSMLVLETHECGGVKVGWFDLAQNYHEHAFSCEFLEKEKDSSFTSKAGLSFPSHIVKILESDVAFMNCIRENKKIDAIKLARAMSGMGLADSKRFVEDLMDRFSNR